VVWLGIIWLGMIAGFGQDFGRYLHQQPPVPAVVHVHAVVFSVWLLIMTAQILLVVGERVAWHRRFGWFAAGWAALMLVVGIWAVMSVQVLHLHQPGSTPQFLSINAVDLAGFALLLAWGVTLRTNAAAHKRVMILATLCLTDAGFSRALLLIPEATNPALWFLEINYGALLLIGLMAWWDWRHGRLMKQFMVGASAILASEVVATTLYFWAPWKVLAIVWIEAWARTIG